MIYCLLKSSKIGKYFNQCFNLVFLLMNKKRAISATHHRSNSNNIEIKKRPSSAFQSQKYLGCFRPSTPKVTEAL